MSEQVRKVITIICTVVFICCLSIIAYSLVTRWLEGQVEKDIADLVTQTPTPTVTPTPEVTPEPTEKPPPVVMEKYAALVEQNPDTIGWLNVEGTAMDYVVMYTPEEPDKYLHLDFYGNYSNRGSLYLDEDTDIWTSDNFIIYGHHMQSSAMFGNLDYFASESYWQDHKTLRFDTIYEEYDYEIVAAFYSRIMNKSEEGFRYYYFIDAEDEDHFNEWVSFLDENQLYDTGIDLEYGDQFITLSTCAYHVANGRFAVVARRIMTDEERAERLAEKEKRMQITEIDTPAPPMDDLPDEPSADQPDETAIDEGIAPLDDTPQIISESFSTNMVLLALGLLLSGTVVLIIRPRRARKH